MELHQEASEICKYLKNKKNKKKKIIEGTKYTTSTYENPRKCIFIHNRNVCILKGTKIDMQ
jgi:hypothetical protein